MMEEVIDDLKWKEGFSQWIETARGHGMQWEREEASIGILYDQLVSLIRPIQKVGIDSSNP